MPNTVTIFISHTWASTDEYEYLVGVLNNAPHLSWKNNSIPQKEALVIWTKDEAARKQRLAELDKRVSLLTKQLDTAREHIKKFERRVNLEAYNDQMREQIKLSALKMEESFASARVIEAECNYRVEQLNREVKEIKKISLGEASESLKQYRESLTGLERDLEYCQGITTRLEQQGDIGRADEYSSKELESTNILRIIPFEALRVNPNLALILHNRIHESDVVMLIADLFVQYRRWMEFEFEVAASLGKPIIGIKPHYQKEFPREIVRRCFRLVEMVKAQIIIAVKDAYNENGCSASISPSARIESLKILL